ncbi:MAG: hypothetical protein WCQ82_04575 [Bacteroidaceae bacterium]
MKQTIRLSLICMICLLFSCNKTGQKQEFSKICTDSTYNATIRQYQKGDYAAVAQKIDTLLLQLEKAEMPDTIARYIGLRVLQGHTYMQLKQPPKSKAAFSKAIKQIDKRLKTDRDVNLIMNRAYLLCFMDKKEEAIQYISSISFSKEELQRFGKIPPLELISLYDKKLLQPH